MAPYAALNSLMHILEFIDQHHPCLPSTLCKQQMGSLHESVCFLQEFLENYSHGGGCSEAKGHLETQIADAAYAAEDTIESHIVDQILAGSSNTDGEKSSSEKSCEGESYYYIMNNLGHLQDPIVTRLQGNSFA